MFKRADYNFAIKVCYNEIYLSSSQNMGIFDNVSSIWFSNISKENPFSDTGKIQFNTYSLSKMFIT